MRNVPKPSRGIATPCVMTMSMTGSLLAVLQASDGSLGCVDELGDDGFKRRRALHRRPAPVLELDPTLVEAVEHANSGQWVKRGLGAEQRLPALAAHDLDLTARPSTAAKASARSFGETRAGPSSSTTRVPCQSSRSRAAAVPP